MKPVPTIKLAAALAYAPTAEARQTLKAFARKRLYPALTFCPTIPAMIEAAPAGAVLLVARLDELARISQDEWQRLRRLKKHKRLSVVALDVPATCEGAAGLIRGLTGAELLTINRLFDGLISAVIGHDARRTRPLPAEPRTVAQLLDVALSDTIAGACLGHRKKPL